MARFTARQVHNGQGADCKVFSRGNSSGRRPPSGDSRDSPITLQNPELRAQVYDITKSSYEMGAEWLRTFNASELSMWAPSRMLLIVLREVT
jgi:hypothetical protein